MLDLLKPSEGPMKVRGQSKVKPVAVGFAKVERFCFAQSCNLKEKGEKCEISWIFGRSLVSLKDELFSNVIHRSETFMWLWSFHSNIHAPLTECSKQSNYVKWPSLTQNRLTPKSNLLSRHGANEKRHQITASRDEKTPISWIFLPSWDSFYVEVGLWLSVGGLCKYPPCFPWISASLRTWRKPPGFSSFTVIHSEHSTVRIVCWWTFLFPVLYPSYMQLLTVALKQGSVTKAYCVFLNRFTLLQTRHMADQA